MRDLKELDKLQEYLQKNHYNFLRKDIFRDPCDVHQIIVFDENEKRDWDAISHYGSFGADQGLLEIMGRRLVRIKNSEVEGWLTAQDIIDRLEEKDNGDKENRENNNSNCE